MCTILFARDTHPNYKLIMAANRDEFYERPTARANWWDEHPYLLAGKDLEAGGTWLGITRSGRFAVITNYREFPRTATFTTSRGALVKDFLTNTTPASDYLQWLHENGHQYDGFNLLFGTADAMHYYSNKGSSMEEVPPGIHGLSNHLLNTPWPKVEEGKVALAKAIEGKPNLQQLETLLQNTKMAPDHALPNTGIGLEWERQLSPLFVRMEKYGTRVSTLLLIDRENNVTFKEVTPIATGMPSQAANEYSFTID